MIYGPPNPPKTEVLRGFALKLKIRSPAPEKGVKMAPVPATELDNFGLFSTGSCVTNSQLLGESDVSV